MQSFYNYSCNLAIQMWEDNIYSLRLSINFPYPRKKEYHLYEHYKDLFNTEERTRLARAGAPIISKFDSIEFMHRNIRDYFIARVLYEQFKFYD